MNPLPVSKKKPGRASRRQFFRQLGTMVAGGALLSTGAAIPWAQAGTGTKKTKDTTMDTSEKNEFSPYVGDSFQIHMDEKKSLQAKLVEVKDRTPHVNKKETEGQPSVQQECFSILFTGPNDHPLEQGTYTFNHKKMGSMDIFIVPVGADDQGMHYEAVFNRLVG